MTTWRRIICLANSYKNGGRCIAGVAFNLMPALWIRPVSVHDPVGLTEAERHYADGDEPGLLDIIELPLVGQREHAYQRENWVIDTTTKVQKSGTVSWEACKKYVSKAETLWANTSSTMSGLNDRVPLEQLEGSVQSLHLIHTPNYMIDVTEPHPESMTKGHRVNARFDYRGVPHSLRVTDPQMVARYQRAPVGEYAVGEALLTVSLGEPYHGHAYKLVAGVMERK